MTAKDCSLPFKDKNDFVNTDTSNGQYSNLNLNQNDKNLSNAFSETSKNVLIEKRKGLNSDLLNNGDSQTKENSYSWKKSAKSLSTTFLNDNSVNEEKAGLKKGKNSNNNSTLSLHIKDYENYSIETSSNLFDGKKECPKDVIKKRENAKQIFVNSTSVIQNSCEFPRQQQENDGEKIPEVAQYRASQRLINANQKNRRETRQPVSQSSDGGKGNSRVQQQQQIMNRLTVGMHVDIKRSDGRVHGAVITEIKEDAKSVNVEWFEKGETKGKEVDYINLIKQNPALDPSVSTNPFLSSKENEVITTKRPSPTIEKNGSLSTTPAVTPTSSDDPTVQVVIRPTNGVAHIPNRKSVIVDSKPTTASSPVIATRKVLPQPKARGLPLRPRPSEAFDPDSTFIAPPPTRETPKYEEPPSLIGGGATASAATANMLNMSLTTNAKSSCVNEVEKLAHKREERRQQQADAKRQINERKSIDPGNPNWQFLCMIRDYRSQVDYRPLQFNDGVIDNRICVCVRKRPLSRAEITRKEIEVLTIPNKDHLVVHQPQQKVDLTKYLENQKFRFDYTFDENTSNEMVYKFTAQPLVKTIFQKGFATCFAYGQTGSGKTHTMGGDFEGKTQDCSKGIYALTAIDVFKTLHNPEYQRLKLQVKCSFFEIYGGKVFDLLGRRAVLRILEDGNKSVQVVGLNEVSVASPEDVMKLIKQGSLQRTAGTTSANANSSRSHAVFQIILKSQKEDIHGKISLIDLAGNERGADTISSDRQVRLEGAEINKSLLALKECIRSMSMNKSHIPFRLSKLTLVLRDSFVNQNAKTCMIAMVSPGLNSVENTLNTLRYADRVKELGSGDEIMKPMADEEFMLDPLDEEENDIPIPLIEQNGHSDDENTKAIHQSAFHVQQAEEKAVDSHMALHAYITDNEELFTRPGEMGYDIEKYAKDSLAFLNQLEKYCQTAKVKTQDLLVKCQKEEELSSSRQYPKKRK